MWLHDVIKLKATHMRMHEDSNGHRINFKKALNLVHYHVKREVLFLLITIYYFFLGLICHPKTV